MSKLLLVCAGGALGSGARYLVGTWSAARWGSDFPWGTLAVNVAGSFLLGLVMVLGLEAGTISPETRLFLAAGVMGGFTTYSSFNHETISLAARGQWELATVYVVGTLIAAWGAGLLGILLGRLVTSAA